MDYRGYARFPRKENTEIRFIGKHNHLYPNIRDSFVYKLTYIFLYCKILSMEKLVQLNRVTVLRGLQS